MPVACATAGMINASGGGVDFGAAVTGVTLEIDSVGILNVVASAPIPPRAEDVSSICTEPRLVPSGRLVVSAETVSVVPPAATTPDDGCTLSHGSLMCTTNDWPASSGPSTMLWTTMPPFTGAAASMPIAGRMKTAAVGPYGVTVGSGWQLVSSARTRAYTASGAVPLFTRVSE